jgi:hypothetical protein
MSAPTGISDRVVGLRRDLEAYLQEEARSAVREAGLHRNGDYDVIASLVEGRVLSANGLSALEPRKWVSSGGQVVFLACKKDEVHELGRAWRSSRTGLTTAYHVLQSLKAYKAVGFKILVAQDLVDMPPVEAEVRVPFKFKSFLRADKGADLAEVEMEETFFSVLHLPVERVASFKAGDPVMSSANRLTRVAAYDDESKHYFVPGQFEFSNGSGVPEGASGSAVRNPRGEVVGTVVGEHETRASYVAMVDDLRKVGPYMPRARGKFRVPKRGTQLQGKQVEEYEFWKGVVEFQFGEGSMRNFSEFEVSHAWGEYYLKGFNEDGTFAGMSRLDDESALAGIGAEALANAKEDFEYMTRAQREEEAGFLEAFGFDAPDREDYGGDDDASSLGLGEDVNTVLQSDATRAEKDAAEMRYITMGMNRLAHVKPRSKQLDDTDSFFDDLLNKPLEELRGMLPSSPESEPDFYLRVPSAPPVDEEDGASEVSERGYQRARSSNELGLQLDLRALRLERNLVFGGRELFKQAPDPADLTRLAVIDRLYESSGGWRDSDEAELERVERDFKALSAERKALLERKAALTQAASVVDKTKKSLQRMRELNSLAKKRVARASALRALGARGAMPIPTEKDLRDFQDRDALQFALLGRYVTVLEQSHAARQQAKAAEKRAEAMQKQRAAEKSKDEKLKNLIKRIEEHGAKSTAPLSAPRS